MADSSSSVALRRACTLAAAFLAGLSGLGLQSLLLSASGMALGYGGSVAIGLTVWLVAWAIGAGLARRLRERRALSLFAVGIALCAAAPAATVGVLYAGRHISNGTVATCVAILALGVPALLQGLFLPLLARGLERVGPLFACNLFGSVVGAFLLADRAVGAYGRVPAALLAGAVALAAGVLGALAKRGASAGVSASTNSSGHLRVGSACVLIVLATAWMSALEWVGYRLGVLWLGGMQNALSAVLCASLVGLAMGAALLPPLLARRRHGVLFVILVCVVCSLWPFFVAPSLARLAGEPLFVKALVLCAPAMLGFGAIVPVVHAACTLRDDSGDRLGRLLECEALGALVGIPLVHYVVVPHHGLAGAIAFALLLGAGAVCVLSRVASIPAVLLAVWAALQPTPALRSPPYANPALTVLNLREDRDFAVAVVDDGMLGERTLLTDGFRAAGTGRDYAYMQALGHLPILLHPAPRRVAVLALGTGTTVGAVSLHDEVERIDVLEISRAVVDAAPYFAEKNHGALSEGMPGLVDDSDGISRVVVKLGDGRATLARAPATYDVITMEPLLPDSPFAVYLYTSEFYDIAKRALKPGGIVCQWVPPHALEPATFAATCRAFERSFTWSGTWVFGTQVVLVGAAQCPVLDPARHVGVSAQLHDALLGLGLQSPSALSARWCADGDLIGGGAIETRPARELTDADPWTVFQERRRGAVLLLDLPLNLSLLAQRAGARRAPFEAGLGPAAVAEADGHRALRAARVAHGYREAELRGARSDRSTSAQFEEHLTAAQTQLGSDPDLARFLDEVSFLADIRNGVSALNGGPDRLAAEAALEPLICAAERRGERADVHLYTAIALARLGSPAADKALAKALKACPNLAATPEAKAARAFGMPDDLWRKLVEGSETARE